MIVSFANQEVHLRDYFYVLRKRRFAIFFFLFLSLAGGVAFTLYEKVLYKASSTILIERENPNIVDFKEVMALDASTTDYYQTQYLMLKSESLISKLIENENLFDDPYFIQLREGTLRRFLRDQPFLPSWFRRFVMEPSPEQIVIERMLVIEPVRNSRLVKVSIKHPNALRAAEIINRLVSLFIRRNLEDRYEIANQATELISIQLSGLKEKVGVAEQRLQDYKEAHHLVNIPSIRREDEFVQDARLELVKIQSEEAKLAKRYLPAHPKRIHIRSQIEGLREKIDEAETRHLQLGSVALEYSQLDREAEGLRKTYQSLLSRLEETASEAKTQASNILVVDQAAPPPRPFKPKPFANMMIAAFLGLVGGVILALFFEYLDSTVRIPEDIEKGLGLDLLGIIPLADKKQGEIFFEDGAHSPAAESFRALRTALLFRLRHVQGCRVLLVTSPNPEEGKTTVAVNLAAAFQQNHLKVLAIDGDLRRPRLHKVLGESSEKGLSDILEGRVTAAEAIHTDVGGHGFDFLSCGSRSEHPTEIVGSQAMITLMEELKRTYDIIIMDSPPYLAVADVIVLGEYAHGMILTTRYHKTDRRHLRQVRQKFGIPDSKLFGVVINQVSVREKDYYYHQYYYYGYGDAPAKR